MSDSVPVIDNEPPPAPANPQPQRSFVAGSIFYCKDPDRDRWIMVTYERFDRLVGTKRMHRVSKAGNRGTLLVSEDGLKDKRPND